MTWLAPLAMVGLAAVGLPVLVHWLARHEADRRRFPTVRFLPTTPPTSVRRHRLTDLTLLALRAAIVAAAALALARPAWLVPPAPGSRPARAIVVDTSVSMARAGAATATAVAALAPQTSGASGGSASAERGDVVIETDDLRHGVAQAAGWLRTAAGAGELVVVSDFQVGALTEADLDGVPAWAGRRFVQVGAEGPMPASTGAGTVQVFGASTAEAAARTVVAAPAPSGDGAPAIVIAFEGTPEFAQLQATSGPVDSPALFDLASRLKTGSEAVFVKTASEPVLGVLTTLRPDSLEAATLIAKALRVAAAPAAGYAELEPDTLPAEVLTAWQREVRSDLAPPGDGARPLHQWLWAVVLLLLAVEAWVRRARSSKQKPATIEEDLHARVA